MEKLIVGNMKMNLTYEDISDYIKKIKYKENVIYCPSSIYVPYFHNYNVGVQNVFYEASGAYTGEISPSQCRSLNVSYAIIGHSERREYFSETDEMINKKIMKSLESGLKVILCVGENKNEDFKTVVSNQLSKDLDSISDYQNIIIAYEPIWAIGTGKIPTLSDIEERVSFIKEITKKNLKVLYGGSVNEKNINTLTLIPNVDGFLVGGASTKINEFNKIMEVALNR